jgi:hypothetical protein
MLKRFVAMVAALDRPLIRAPGPPSTAPKFRGYCRGLFLEAAQGRWSHTRLVERRFGLPLRHGFRGAPLHNQQCRV